MDINSILKNHNIDAINDNEKVIDRLVAKNIKEYKNEFNEKINQEINQNTNNIKTDIENMNKRINEVFIFANNCNEKLKLKEDELLKTKKQLDDTIIGKQQKEKELNKLNSEILNLQSKINSLNNTIFDLEKQSHETNELRNTLNNIKKERDNALSKINNLQSEINSLNNIISSLNSEISILKNNQGKKWARGTLQKPSYTPSYEINGLDFAPNFVWIYSTQNHLYATFMTSSKYSVYDGVYGLRFAGWDEAPALRRNNESIGNEITSDGFKFAIYNEYKEHQGLGNPNSEPFIFNWIAIE